MCETKCWNPAFSEKENNAISYVVDAVSNGFWYYKSCLVAARENGVSVRWVDKYAKDYIKAL